MLVFLALTKGEGDATDVWDRFLKSDLYEQYTQEGKDDLFERMGMI